MATSTRKAVFLQHALIPTARVVRAVIDGHDWNDRSAINGPDAYRKIIHQRGYFELLRSGEATEPARQGSGAGSRSDGTCCAVVPSERCREVVGMFESWKRFAAKDCDQALVVDNEHDLGRKLGVGFRDLRDGFSEFTRPHNVAQERSHRWMNYWRNVRNCMRLFDL